MKRYHLLILSAALILMGGACNGLLETVSHHYGAFAERFSGANPLWWNPDLSWQQKYEGGIVSQGPAFPGSTTVLVFLTDAYHLFGELERVFTRCGFAVLAFSSWTSPWIVRRFLLNISGSMAVGWLVWSAGFHIVYTLYF